MFVILVYDVNEKRVNKILKICRKYLRWVQNSVFEGEITLGKLEKLKHEISRVMNESEDSVRIYMLESEKYVKKEILGLDKLESSNFL